LALVFYAFESSKRYSSKPGTDLRERRFRREGFNPDYFRGKALALLGL